MARVKICLFCVILSSLLQLIASNYIAAVVEYQHFKSTSPNETVEFNIRNYVDYIERAKNSKADIIVFPEYGLTGDVYDPEEYATELPNVGENNAFNNYWLEILSNAAKANSIYVAVNLLEKVTNSNNQSIYYNTNLVFDKNGYIVAKYRKINLYDEPRLSSGAPHQNTSTFVTDFGITFGIFTCADIIHSNPSKNILLNDNVTDIVFPAAWTSSLPFFHSLSIFAGYAIANGVNVLAANLNAPYLSMGGSGIFGGDGTVYGYQVTGSNASTLIIGNIQNVAQKRMLGGPLRGFDNLDNTTPLQNYVANRFFEAEKYVFKAINVLQTSINEEVCHKGFCCRFNITVSSLAENTTDVYKILAYSGRVQVIENIGNKKICSLVACQTSDLSTCGTQNVAVGSRFQSIIVESTVPLDQEIRPLSLTTELLPVFNITYSSVITNSTKKVLFSNQLEQGNLLAFGLMADSGANVSVFSTVLLLSVLFCNFIFY